MSHTVIIDNEEIDRQTSNIVNRIQRHCRIGKVKHKLPFGEPYAPYTPPAPVEGWPWIGQKPTDYHQSYDMCRQCVGKACGNAACPSRGVSVC